MKDKLTRRAGRRTGLLVGPLALALLLGPLGPSGAATTAGVAQAPPCGASAPRLSLLGGLSQTACLLRALKYEFHTVTVDANGRRIVRTQRATVGFQSRINLDGKGPAELVGKVKPSGGLDKLTLTISRIGAKRPPLAASVEVVAADPTGAIGAEKIAFGYDQLDGTIPDSFSAEVDLGDLLDETKPTLALSMSQTTPSASTSLVAATFDGTADRRVNKVAGRIRYDRSPTAATLSYLMTEAGQLRMTTDRPGPVTGSLDFDDGQDVSVNVVARDMPNTLSVDFDLATPRIRYTGTNAQGVPSKIGQLDVRIASDTPLFGRATQLRAAIKGLPSGTELIADSANGDFSLAASQPIDSLEIFAGSRPEQAGDLPADGGQGVHYQDRTGQAFAVGARILGLRSLRAGIADSTTIDAVTSGGKFTMQADIDGLSAAAVIDELPGQAIVHLDTAAGTLSYSGSDVIESARFSLDSETPLLFEASEFSLLIEDLPTEVALAADFERGAASLVANAPLGLVEVLAQSEGAVEDLSALNGGQSGLVLRDRAGEFLAFGRVRGLRELTFSGEPMALEAHVQQGQPFVVDAFFEQGVGPAGGIHARLAASALPGQVSLRVLESGDAAAGYQYRASDRVGELSLDVSGIELLDGADTARVVIHDLPTAIDVSFPAEGPVAVADANAPIGQLRLAVGSGAVDLPARSIAGDILHDRFQFASVPGTTSVSARITAMRGLSVSLDPINIALRQDSDRARPLDLLGTVQAETGVPMEFAATMETPGARTSLSVEADAGGPARLIFDNAGPMRVFDLHATGIPGVESFDATFENLSPRLSMCLDDSGECNRTNPRILPDANISDGRPYRPKFSMDFDDFGTKAATAKLTTLNAVIMPTRAGEDADAEPLVIEDLRFENLAFDMGTSTAFRGACTFGTSVPRIYAFIDSRGRPFVINGISAKPRLRAFEIGKDSDPATATHRFAWLKGCDGFRFRNEDTGTMDCSGHKSLVGEDGSDALDRPLRAPVLPLCED